MKIQIKSLRAINCGPLRDVTIDFTTNGKPRPVTLLAGANGSGKTTALELLVSLAKFIPRQQIPFELPSTYTRANYARLDLLVDGLPLAIDVGDRPANEHVPTDVIRLLPINNWHTTESAGVTADAVRLAITSQWFKPLAEVRANCQIGSTAYVPHQRGIVHYPGEQIHREETFYNFVLKYESPIGYEGTLDSYLIWLEYAEPVEYERTIRFLNSLDFDGKTFGVSRKELKATVTTHDGYTHGLAELSSGEQNIIEILLGLHRYLLPHSIVLIDEIENSLHPAFQYKMGEALKKLQEEVPFQLIATSHSPAFLKIFGPENTLLLTEF